MPQNRRSFVETLDFLSSLGHGRTGRERRAAGVNTEGPVLLVSDLCIMKPHHETHEFEVVSLHPGVSRERVAAETGWPVRFAPDVTETPAPTPVEIETLRDLHARTARAHGTIAQSS
jgi:glutaconate CoA-transferase subunit B